MDLRALRQGKLSVSLSTVFVLFSGHNDRAVISLCRFFASNGLPFAIVSAGRSDAIVQTAWAARCIISRIDQALDVPLFNFVLEAVRGVYGATARPAYCPTTEFMNHFVLHERVALLQLGWIVTLPATHVYAELTSKGKSREVVEQLIGLSAPAELPWDHLLAPCILKPRSNVGEGKVYYPRLCCTQAELTQALKDTDAQRWFAQSWVNGQSYYLCAYITADGRHAHFWQQNLLQQPGGKSIVLARTVPNPGIAIEHFLLGLVERGYHGPLMMEVIHDDAGRFHYIEINPRFWGPLQLALDACPDILRLFAHDAGVQLDLDATAPGDTSFRTHWYAWQLGAQIEGCRRYPALTSIESTQHLQELLDRRDVYAHPDTLSLHGRH